MIEPTESRPTALAASELGGTDLPLDGQKVPSFSTRDISPGAYKKGLLILFLAGLMIRTAFLVEHARTPSFAVPTLDQVYYDTVARMLLTGEDLHELHGFRPLLYPIFLAGCYKIAGSWGPDLAIVVQHVLGVGIGVLVALLGARLFRNRLSGLIGGALYLLAPVPLYFEGELLIEPTYLFLICFALGVHVKAATSDRWKAALLWTVGGALIVLAGQARANILVFLAVYPLFVLYSFGRAFRGVASGAVAFRAREVMRAVPRHAAAIIPLCGLLGALLMAVPWGYFNLCQSDHFHLLPNAGGVALYCGNKRTADGMTPEQERRIYSGDRYQDSIETWAREDYESAMRSQGRQPDTDPMAISRYWTRKTIEEIKAAPISWLRLMAKKTWLTFWNAEVPNNKAFAFLQQDYLWLRFLPVRWVVLLAFFPAGLWAALRFGNRGALVVLFSYGALYSAANIVFFICDRYRYPVWPVAAVFAGGGVMAIFEALQLKPILKRLGISSKLSRMTTVNAGNLVWLAGSAALMVTLSLPNWFHAKLPSFSRDYLFRSIAWYEKGHFREALDDINRSVELNPAEASALHHRGNVLFALNRLQEAEGAYEQALVLSSDEAGIWNNLGATLVTLGRPNEALQAYQRAVECNPPSKNAYLGAAMLATRLGQLEQAASTLSRLDQLAPSPNPAALAIRAVLARKQGDLAQADTLERAARRLDAQVASWAIERASQ